MKVTHAQSGINNREVADDVRTEVTTHTPLPLQKASQDKKKARRQSTRSSLLNGMVKQENRKGSTTGEIARIDNDCSVCNTLGFISQSTIFMPENPKRMGWDICMMGLILYYAFAVPTRIGFSQEPKYPMLEHFFTGCFAVDILINFNTAVIGPRGTLIVQRRLIAQDYLKAWFWIDFVATFPFEMVTGGEGEDGEGSNTAGVARLGKVFRLLRIFKLLRILKLGRILQRFQYSTSINPNWYLLGRTAAVMVFMLHWTACGYWMVVANQPADGYGRTEEHHEEWLPPPFVLHAPFTNQYLFAFFWAISVVTGAGWDIIPATSMEVVFSSVMILTGTVHHTLYTLYTLYSSVMILTGTVHHTLYTLYTLYHPS
jgi:hypothetical protein